jgi:hypothetical protein
LEVTHIINNSNKLNSLLSMNSEKANYRGSIGTTSINTGKVMKHDDK